MYQGFPADLLDKTVGYLRERLSSDACSPHYTGVLIHALFQLPACGFHQWYPGFRIAAVRQVRICALSNLPQSICDTIST